MLWWTGMIATHTINYPLQLWANQFEFRLHLRCGSTTGGCSDGQVWLQLVQLIIPYSSELINLNLDYIYAVAPLLEDALMDRYDSTLRINYPLQLSARQFEFRLHLRCGSSTGGCSDGQVWLQLLQLIIPYSSELVNLNLDYIYAVAPLLEDALMDRYDCNSYN